MGIRLRRLKLEHAAEEVGRAARTLNGGRSLPRPEFCRKLYNAADDGVVAALEKIAARYEGRSNDAVLGAVERYMGANPGKFAKVQGK